MTILLGNVLLLKIHLTTTMTQFLHQFPVQDANNVTTNIKIIENGMNS